LAKVFGRAGFLPADSRITRKRRVRNPPYLVLTLFEWFVNVHPDQYIVRMVRVFRGYLFLSLALPTIINLMIKEIQAKVMLSTVRGEDRIFGLKYNMNLYRGCQHRCIYCDSRSACYEIENFDGDILVKVNAIELLEKELPRKRVIGTIGTGSMNDPYMPVEKHFNLTGRALEVIARFGFPVHIITKSDLVLRDIALLEAINHVHASVCFTLTTVDDTLAKRVEPLAPPPSARLAAMQALAEHGIPVGTTLMPVLPFIEDNAANISAIVEQTALHGGKFIIPWFGMSLRDRQREYYYARLDESFPGLRVKYEKRFGSRYGCSANNAPMLEKHFRQLCSATGLATCVPCYQPEPEPRQLALW
jgi:DNA repair photolyase